MYVVYSPERSIAYDERAGFWIVVAAINAKNG